MPETQTADAKTEEAVTDAAHPEGSSATGDTFGTLEEKIKQAESEAQTSPDNQATEGAGDLQETPDEKAEREKQEHKSRTARRFDKVLDDKKKAEDAAAQAAADKAKAEERAKLAEDEVKRLQSLPSSVSPQPQQQQGQKPPEQTSLYWARKYHEGKNAGTATEEELQRYANQYAATKEQETAEGNERKIEQKFYELVTRAQHATFVESQLSEINEVTPFRRKTASGHEFVADSPVLILAYSKARDAGAAIQTQENLIYWLGRAQVDLLRNGASAQAGANQKLQQKQRELMSRTALERGGPRPASTTSGNDAVSGQDLHDLAVRQFRSGK